MNETMANRYGYNYHDYRDDLDWDEEDDLYDDDDDLYDDEEAEALVIPEINLDIHLTEDQLPGAISSQVKVMKILEQRIKLAEARVESAKEKSELARHDVSVFKKKKAIEELQHAVLSQSEALFSESQAMRLLFLNQKQLANVSSGLFTFGLVNMTSNRTVYQRLKCELEKASEEELNELAKAELMKIVKQLKAQEDIYNRIENQATILETLQKDVTSLKSTTAVIPGLKSSVDALKAIPRTPAPVRAAPVTPTPVIPAPVVVQKRSSGWPIALSTISLLISLGALALVLLRVMF